MITKLLVNYIISKYDRDMGWHFDEYQGNEEEVYEETYALFETASLKDKIKLLRGIYGYDNTEEILKYWK